MSSEVKIVVEWQVWEGVRATTFADAREARRYADSCVGFALDQGMPVNVDIRKVTRHFFEHATGSDILQARIAAAESEAARLRNLETPNAERMAEKLEGDVLLLRALLREMNEASP